MAVGAVVSPAGAAIYSGQELYKLQLPPGITSASAGTQAVAAGGEVVGYGFNSTGKEHAIVWSASSQTDLSTTTTSFDNTGANAIGGGDVVGFGYSSTGYYAGNQYALLWSGGAGAPINLNPAGFTQSVAYAATSGQEAGAATDANGNTDAILWKGTAASFVNLNPTGFTYSVAQGVANGQVVGYGFDSTGNMDALLWNEPTNVAINLNPTSLFTQSMALGVGNALQVGYGITNQGANHAVLWAGSALSAIDLNPVGFNSSEAWAVGDGIEVGDGISAATGDDDALMWVGTAQSFFNLAALLPSSIVWSQAYSVDAQGDIFGVAEDAQNNSYAVEWSPVPEPSSLVLLTGATTALAARRSRRLA